MPLVVQGPPPSYYPAVTNDVVWRNWQVLYTTTTTAGTSFAVPAGIMWQSWNQQYTGTTATTVQYTTVDVSGCTWGQWNQAHEETREQREARERREVADARNRLRAAEARARAHDRALDLLLSLLSEEQAASYRDNGWFVVRGSDGRRYRIRRGGQSGNVDLLPEVGDEREATFCAHPPGRLPDPDAHVAQMLHLVTDAPDFRKIANVHYLRPRDCAA